MDAKKGKGKTRKESTPIKVWVTPEEKVAIGAKADAHSLSASGYLRRLGLALPVASTIDQRAILELVKINADLGRLGGLIKMWLTTNADFQSSSAQAPCRLVRRALPGSGDLKLSGECGTIRRGVGTRSRGFGQSSAAPIAYIGPYGEEL